MAETAITERPNISRLRYSDQPNTPPDLIIDKATDNIKYLCWRYFKSSDVNNCWKICKVTTITHSANNIETKFEFPFGSASYLFNPDDIELYTFIYQY